MAWNTESILELDSGSRIGKQYTVLFPLTSTNYQSYTVDFSSYIVKDEVSSHCYVLQIIGKSETVEIPRYIHETLGTKADRFIFLPVKSFTHQGHNCTIHELHGPDLRRIRQTAHVSAKWTRKSLREILEALDLLHSNGVVHGDIKEWSTILTYPELNDSDEASVKTFYEPNDDGVVSWNEFGSGPYGHESHLEFRVKLQNMRKSFLLSQPPKNSSEYMGRLCPPPEALLHGIMGVQMDMWYFGIMMADIIACSTEFDTLVGDRLENRAEQFFICQRLLGPLPQKYATLMKGFEETRRSLHTNDLLQKIFISRTEIAELDITEDLEEERSRDLFCEESVRSAVDLLKRLLAFDPDERLSAKDALKHPFFVKM